MWLPDYVSAVRMDGAGRWGVELPYVEVAAALSALVCVLYQEEMVWAVKCGSLVLQV